MEGETRGGVGSLGGTPTGTSRDGLSGDGPGVLPSGVLRIGLLWVLLPLLLWAAYLLLLPLFPSQDGPTHLMSGGILFDCLADREPASSYYFWRSTKLTNQLCTLGLGLLQEVGFSPRWAEGLWHLLLLALLVLTWKRMLQRVAAAPSAMLLLLLPFMGQVLHMGFYNFLAGVHLGLLAWTYRAPGWKNPLSDGLFLLALYAHPLGAACYLGLCGFDSLLQKRWRDLLILLPHAVLFYLVSSGNTGGRMGRVPLQFPDFFGETWIPVQEQGLIFLRLPLLLLLILALRMSWPRLSPAVRSRRLQLCLAASLPLLASGLFPDMFGTATHLRIRAAYLGWILLLVALAPPVGAEGRVRLGLRQCLVLGLLAFNFVGDRSLAIEQQAFLDRMPRPKVHSTVLAGYDLYQAEVLPLLGHLRPAEPIDLRHNSLLDIETRLHFNPWMHIPDRWAHERGLLSLNDHQALYAHSPLGHRNAPELSWREGMEYKCSQLPLDELAGAADLILFANLDPDWLSSARPRQPDSVSVIGSGQDWVLLDGGGEPGAQARLSTPFFTQKLLPERMPQAWLVPPTLVDQRVQVDLEAFARANAYAPFQVFVLDLEKKTFRRARKEEAWPTEGIYDGKASFRFERLERPAKGQLFLLPR